MAPINSASFSFSILRKAAILIFFLFCFLRSNAQESTRFYVYSFPQNAYMELDGQKIISSDTGITATTGIHHLKVWLPDYMAIDSTINLSKNTPNIYRIYLKLSPQFIAHQRALTNFKIKQASRMAPPLLGLVLTGMLWFGSTKIAHGFYDDAKQNESDYASTKIQSTMDHAKNDFKKNRSNYKFYTAMSYGFAGIAVIPIVWTCKVAITNHHRQPPARPAEN